MTTENSNGRIVAVQQQIFFAKMLSDNMEIRTDFLLRKLSLSGLRLTSDVEEIALDAAAIQPLLEPDTIEFFKIVNDLENL